MCAELARAEAGIVFDSAGPELAWTLKRYFLVADAACNRKD